jgi:hypothetical protein
MPAAYVLRVIWFIPLNLTRGPSGPSFFFAAPACAVAHIAATRQKNLGCDYHIKLAIVVISGYLTTRSKYVAASFLPLPKL